jgi:hypothetical protein
MNIKTKIARTLSASFTLAILLLLSSSLYAQVSPFGGLGQAQFFDNSGAPLIAGVLYSYQAGTSTQQATYTDSTGTVQNVNPITFGSGARVAIWLTTAQNYKFVLCQFNDGPFCSAGDILFSVDNVPGGASGGGGGCGSTCTSIFISSTASPATSGALRLASGDSICWRNAAGSANLCFSKDASDRLIWAGGSLLFPEIAPPSGIAANDLLWADSSAHRWMMKNNGGSGLQVVASGNDIGTTDQVLGVHFGATQELFGNTAPTTTQCVQFNGTFLVGATGAEAGVCGVAVTASDVLTLGANTGPTTLVTPAANGFYRFSCYVVTTRAATSSSTLPQCQVNWQDADTAVAEVYITTVGSTANTLGVVGQMTTGATSGPNSFLYAKSGVAITYQTTNYATSGATSMQYAVHVRLEGPF